MAENEEKKVVKNRVITFASKTKVIPEATEKVNKTKGWVEWGKDNTYPLFLIDLYDGSAWHQGLVKSKSYYIAGGGVEASSGVNIDEFLRNGGTDFGIDEVLEGCAFDLEMFSGFAVVGTWNRLGTKVAFWEHIDFESIRQDKEELIFHISDDWSSNRQSEEKTGYHTIKALNMNERSGRFLLYYKEPSKKSKGSKGHYPKPSYQGGIKAIQTDSDISAFHLNEINNGFSAGTGMNFANGVPETDEEAKEETKKIKKSLTGVENAGEVFITFSDGTDNAPTILRLTGDDLDKRYNLTEKSVQQNILVAHSTTSPILHGIRVEGLSIGSGTEMQIAYEIFKNTYVSTKQKRLGYGLNKMAELSGFAEEMILKPAPLIADERLVQSQQSVEINIGAEKKKFSDEVEIEDEQSLLDLFSEVGVPRDERQTFVRKLVPADVTNEDVIDLEGENFKQLFDVVGDIGFALKDFDKTVLNLLSEGNDAQHIAKAIDATLEDVIKSIEVLKALNLFDGEVTELANEVIQEIPIDISEFGIVYSYELRPELTDDVIPGTRDFCRTLIGLNKFYTRAEIETISGAVGRDVWKYRGGWWNDNGTNKPFCRHIWVQNLVKIN